MKKQFTSPSHSILGISSLILVTIAWSTLGCRCGGDSPPSFLPSFEVESSHKIASYLKLTSEAKPNIRNMAVVYGQEVATFYFAPDGLGDYAYPYLNSVAACSDQKYPPSASKLAVYEALATAKGDTGAWIGYWCEGYIDRFEINSHFLSKRPVYRCPAGLIALYNRLDSIRIEDMDGTLGAIDLRKSILFSADRYDRFKVPTTGRYEYFLSVDEDKIEDTVNNPYYSEYRKNDYNVQAHLSDIYDTYNGLQMLSLPARYPRGASMLTPPSIDRVSFYLDNAGFDGVYKPWKFTFETRPPKGLHRLKLHFYLDGGATEVSSNEFYLYVE